MEVVVFEQGSWVSYGACGLPYYVQGEIASLEDLIVMEPRKVIEERGIDLRRHHEVTAIDRDTQTVTVETDDGRYEESYDATGGRAPLPDVPGAELDGIFSIRSLEAGRALKHYLAPRRIRARSCLPQRFRPRTRPSPLDWCGASPQSWVQSRGWAVSRDAFVERECEVHVFDSGERVLPSFGSDITGVVEDHLRERGIELHLETTVEHFHGEGGEVDRVETDDGVVDLDVVVVDIGVEPQVELAMAAEIELGPTGAITTDEYGRTNDPNVYAAGDCAEKTHLLTGDPVHWPFGLAANRAGRAVGRTIAGRQSAVGGIVGTLVMKALDLQVARTGIIDHDEARAAGYEPVSALITTVTRAHYYPGWSRMVVHATADANTGRLLGANMVAKEGTAHRINSAATAISAELSVEALGSLDFGYAPPFGPVWDPILGVGKVLEGKLS